MCEDPQARGILPWFWKGEKSSKGQRTVVGLECYISCLLLWRVGSLGPSLKLAIANGNETGEMEYGFQAVFRVLDFILTTMRRLGRILSRVQPQD